MVNTRLKSGSMFDLGDYVPYLLNRAGSRIATAFSKDMRRFGINLQIWRVLASLYQDDGQRIGHLAETTCIEVSTLSRLLTTMEGKALVRRRRVVMHRTGQPPRGDARAVGVHLSAEGRQLVTQIIPLALHYESVALDGFTDEEHAQIRGLLRRLYDNMAALKANGTGMMKTPLRHAGSQEC